jgi:hypothetical protein
VGFDCSFFPDADIKLLFTSASGKKEQQTDPSLLLIITAGLLPEEF